MYCSKCGKEIDSGIICRECAFEEMNKQYTPEVKPASPQYTQWMPEPNNIMYGFGKALTGTILGFVAYIWTCMAMMYAIAEEPGGLALVFLSIPGIVLPLIFGISSIKTYGRRKKANCRKPIPALILAIAGVALAGLAIFFSFITMVCTLAVY